MEIISIDTILMPINNGADLNTYTTPGTYFRAYTGSSSNVVDNVPSIFTTSTFTLEVLPEGENGQVIQRISRCDKTKPYVMTRVFYSGSWSA